MDKVSFVNFNLSKEILKAIDNLGYVEPSEVQVEVIPKILTSKDIIVKSQTGSGKTAAFGIPLCERVEVEEVKVQALVLVPTRELALQVKENISHIGRLKKVRCAAVFGKQPFNDQVRELKQRVHIVAGTPGRIIDHLERGNLDLSSLKYMIIDEADKMLSMGFIEQIQEILDKAPKERVTALFSATIPDKIESLCREYMKSPDLLSITSKVFNREKIKESYIEVEEKNKLKALWRIMYSVAPEAAIVFCNTKDAVRAVYRSLKEEGFLLEQLHGDMEQKDRIKTMERFKNKEFKVLVASDIAARGIHIDHITHVFNYDIPMETENYVHRIGRTGRAGNEGTAISLVSYREKKYLNAIEEYIGYQIEKVYEPSDEEVKEGKKIFKESQREISNRKPIKKSDLHSEITKIYLSGGKKKKLRAVDILGALSNLEGLSGEDIGIIDVQDGFSYVDILNNKGKILLGNYKDISIKGKEIRIQKAKI